MTEVVLLNVADVPVLYQEIPRKKLSPLGTTERYRTMIKTKYWEYCEHWIPVGGLAPHGVCATCKRHDPDKPLPNGFKGIAKQEIICGEQIGKLELVQDEGGNTNA